jgi:hypothetical protein
MWQTRHALQPGSLQFTNRNQCVPALCIRPQHPSCSAQAGLSTAIPSCIDTATPAQPYKACAMSPISLPATRAAAGSRSRQGLDRSWEHQQAHPARAHRPNVATLPWTASQQLNNQTPSLGQTCDAHAPPHSLLLFRHQSSFSTAPAHKLLSSRTQHPTQHGPASCC